MLNLHNMKWLNYSKVSYIMYLLFNNTHTVHYFNDADTIVKNQLFGNVHN